MPKTKLYIGYSIKLLSPHDALMHHFTSLKTDLIPILLMVIELQFP